MGRVYRATGIEILNTSGGTVVDGVGLVSTTNFTYGATDITDQTVSGTAWSILTSGTVPVVLTRNAVVCYTYFGYGTVSASSLAEFQMFNGDNTSTYIAPPARTISSYKSLCLSAEKRALRKLGGLAIEVFRA